MLDELAPYVSSGKTKDLLKRIEHRNPDQAIPAEYELALGWGVSKIAHVQIERQFGKHAPDIYSEDLIPSAPAAIEVTALSNEALGGKALMRRAANIINAQASKTVRGAADHLYYEFLEESGTLPADRSSWPFTRYFRKRRISKRFTMSKGLEQALADWLNQRPPTTPLTWEDEHVAVVISWRDYVHPQGNTFSSMPAVCYDTRDNPLYDALKAKAKQLRGVPNNVLKGIFVCDAGCSLLRDIDRIGGGIHEVRGAEILRRFIDRNEVDFVVAFTPRQVDEYSPFGGPSPRIWHVHACSKELTRDQFSKIESMAGLLPSPYLHGYQARSWHEQNMFDPQGRGHYLPPIYSSNGPTMSIKVSARGIQEFLAGRITREEFGRWVGGTGNLFESQLARGRTFSNVRLESSGTEEDDDYLIFEFEEDPGASPLRAPPVEAG